MRQFLIALLVLFAPFAIAETIRPDDLLKGIPLHKKQRMFVQDIVAGSVSVKHLFEPIHDKAPSVFEYYVTTASHSLTLRVGSPEQLETVLETLALQHTTKLKVILRDDRDTFLRGKWPFDESYFNSVVEWTVAETPCEQITHIVYRKVRDAVRERLREGSTGRRVALNTVFDILLRGEIDSFMRSLGPARGRPPCLDTFELLQWLKGEQVAGFGFGEYELREGMRESLRPAADALLEMRRDWKQYRLRIRVVGYTDASTVEKKKELRAEATGIELTEPLDVRYLGCSGDTLDDKTFRYAALGDRRGSTITGQIVNNCELGAVRAYVALAYFAQRLGREGIDYEYATGGVHPLAQKRDATHRKLDIQFEVRAASDER